MKLTLHFPRSARTVASALVVAAALAGATADRATAADNGQWSVFPTTVPGQLLARPYFEPLMSPGVQVQDSVTVANKTNAPLTFNLYAVDAFNTRDGGFALRHRDEPKTDMGAWIHLATSQLAVPAQSAASIPFFIVPAASAAPGDHPGGIVAENTTANVSSSGSVHTRQILAVGVRVYGRIRGPIHPGLEITGFHITTTRGLAGLFGAGVGTQVEYTVVNTGNVRLTPKAALSVSPLLGGTRHRARDVPELLPHGSAVVRENVSTIVPFLRLHARLGVTATGAATAASTTGWVIPWLLLLVIALVIASIVWYRRRHGGSQDVHAYPTPPYPRGEASLEPRPVEVVRS